MPLIKVSDGGSRLGSRGSLHASREGLIQAGKADLLGFKRSSRSYRWAMPALALLSFLVIPRLQVFPSWQTSTSTTEVFLNHAQQDGNHDFEAMGRAGLPGLELPGIGGPSHTVSHGHKMDQTWQHKAQCLGKKRRHFLKGIKGNSERAQLVVNAMVSSWDAYQKSAWGHDELCPLTGKPNDELGGMGATIIDSIDTLHLMGQHSRVDQAKAYVARMSFERNETVSVFESTIRIIGGLLSAHDLLGDEVYLTKAQELADKLLGAFDTPNGIPVKMVNLSGFKFDPWRDGSTFLADFGTTQMEFFLLTHKTGRGVYKSKSLEPIKYLRHRYSSQGLMPVNFDIASGDFSSQEVTLGGRGDSYYEYLLKVWILFGKTRFEWMREMWEQAMDEMIKELVAKTQESKLTYLMNMGRTGFKDNRMEHLACFVAGMLALGVHHKAMPRHKADQYMEVAEGLAETCFQMYKRMPTGLSPESIIADTSSLVATDFEVDDPWNIQRPEAVESFFVLYRVTGKPKYREYAWEVFCAFEAYTKVQSGGYMSLEDVREFPPVGRDRMQSFWLAETLKYLYLIFSEDKISLDEWVFNTEAHPLRIRKDPDKYGASWYLWGR